MIKPTKLIFVTVLYLAYFIMPSSVLLFNNPQSSILIVYFSYLYLSSNAYSNINIMSISRYEIKWDFCFDFLIKQSLLCTVYMLTITAIGYILLFFKTTQNVTWMEIVMFLIGNIINLIILSLILLLLRLIYGYVPSFTIVSLYIVLTIVSYVFFGHFTYRTTMDNPFVLLFGFGEPFTTTMAFGYAFIAAIIIIYGYLLKKRDLKI